MQHTAYIGLGSNLGDRAATLARAVEMLRQSPGVESVEVSSLYETAPMGGPSMQGLYLNAAAAVRTSLAPEPLLDLLLSLEVSLGRERRERWGPRTIDLDLLLYDERVIQTERLTLPHPRMHDRRFVLEPLAELAPGAVHPVLRRTVTELLREAR